MEKRVRVGIVGVSGYGGGEIARLVLGHPQLELTYVTSSTYAGQPLHAALPGTAKRSELSCEKFDIAAAIAQCDIVFLAGEAGVAMQWAEPLLAAGKRVIDLSADFRLRNPADYKEWYKSEHTAAHMLPQAVYGLPELAREQIASAKLVANPGCYPTSAALALAPLLRRQLVDNSTIIVDSQSGVSGAGRAKFGLDYHFCEVSDSLRPYGVGGTHRHTPEIEQTLGDVAGSEIRLTFTPHLVPIARGILTTAYANTTASLDTIHAAFAEDYADEPFVYVHPIGGFPASKHVQGTNMCHIGVGLDRRTQRAIVVSTIDNLGKGAAGQAVQNLNILCGFDETEGLSAPAMWP